MKVFNLDKLVSVVKTNSLYYKHNGNSLEQVQNDNEFLKLEREELYKKVQAIEILKVSKINQKIKTILQQYVD